MLACAAICACGAVEEPEAAPAVGAPSTPNTPSTRAPSTPSEPQREGHVTVHTTGDTITAGAEFGPKFPTGAPLPEGCTLLADDANDAKRAQGESDSAGIIDLDVVLDDEPNALQIEFNAERKNYQYIALGTEGHAAGKIHVHARGGVVPAFEAEVAAIPPTKVLAPAPGAAVGARDLPVSWTFDGEDRHSIVYLSTLEKDVRCYVPKGKGRELVIPAALVSELLASNGELRFFVVTARTTNVDVGDYRVSLSHNTSTHVELTRE